MVAVEKWLTLSMLKCNTINVSNNHFKLTYSPFCATLCIFESGKYIKMATGMKIDLARLRGSIKNKRELAKKLGISRNSLYRKLNGRARLYWEELNRICFYLDTDAKSFWSECPMYISNRTKLFQYSD